jgi:elongator complex protein 1
MITTVSLKLTPLRLANVPPPMSLHKLSLEHKAIDVAVSMSGTRLAVLSDIDLAVYALGMSKKPVQMPSLLWRSDAFKGHTPRHVAFVGDEQIFILTDDWDEEESSVWVSNDKELVCRGPILESGRVSSIVSSADYQKLYMQFQDGAIYEAGPINAESESPLLKTLVQKLPSFAPEVRIASWDEQVSMMFPLPNYDIDLMQPICFGLTKGGALYANERVLVRNCTSFVVTPGHLIFTTTQHLLKFVHLVNVEGTYLVHIKLYLLIFILPQTLKYRQTSPKKTSGVAASSEELASSPQCQQHTLSFYRCREEI